MELEPIPVLVFAQTGKGGIVNSCPVPAIEEELKATIVNTIIDNVILLIFFMVINLLLFHNYDASVLFYNGFFDLLFIPTKLRSENSSTKIP